MLKRDVKLQLTSVYSNRLPVTALNLYRVSADAASAVDVRRNSGRRDGRPAGTVPDQSAALDSDGALGEAATALWQPAAY